MTLGIGILGAGRIARTGFVPAVAQIDGAQIVAVLSRDEGRGKVFAEENGIAKSYTDLDKLLADPEIDAVVVATPDVLHEPQVIAAARAGKHVLCEKPMATTYAACERMAEAVRDSGVTFMMGYSNRFSSGIQRIKELMDAGEIGEVRCARMLLTSQVQDPKAWRAHPETARYWSMSASGTHVIDVFRWFFGEPAKVGGGLASPRFGSANDEIATCVMDYPGRLLAEFTVASILPGGNRLELHGEEGAIVGENVFNRRGGQTITCKGESFELPSSDLFLGEVSEFVAAIAEGREPWITLEDGVRNLRIIEAVGDGNTMVEL